MNWNTKQMKVNMPDWRLYRSRKKWKIKYYKRQNRTMRTHLKICEKTFFALQISILKLTPWCLSRVWKIVYKSLIQHKPHYPWPCDNFVCCLPYAWLIFHFSYFSDFTCDFFIVLWFFFEYVFPYVRAPEIQILFIGIEQIE